MRSKTGTGTRAKGKGNTLDSSPAKKKSTLKSSNRFGNSMHNAEMHQLDEFVKTRSTVLDEEIKAMRNKLKNSVGNGTSRSSNWNATNRDAVDDDLLRTMKEGRSIENDDIKDLQFMGNLNIQGKKLSKVDLSRTSSPPRKGKYNHDDFDSPTKNDDFMLDFLEKNHFDKSSSLLSDKKKSSKFGLEEEDYEDDALASPSPVIASSYSINDRLVQIIATFKIKLEDAGYSLREFYSLLFHEKHTESNKYPDWVNINHFTDVLQTDLLFPLTKQDQMILLQEYGKQKSKYTKRDEDTSKATHSELINLSAFISDAGMKPLSAQYIDDEHSRQYEALLHENEKLKQSLASTDQRKVSEESKVLQDKMNHLSSENSKYQKELSSINTEFFEELENLKHRYQTLEHIVGEDPYHNPMDSLSMDDQRKKHLPFQKDYFENELLNEKKLKGEKALEELERDSAAEKDPLATSQERKKEIPLSRLAWASKQSMHAMDRADYGSDLVQGPKARKPLAASVNIPTRSKTSGMLIDDDHIGQVMGKNRWSIDESMNGSLMGRKSDHLHSKGEEEEYLSRSMKSMLIPSERDPETFENKYRTGGYHGIGSGTYAATSSNSGNTGGGKNETLSNLCERRLAFELSSTAKPSQVITTLIHKIRETGRANKLAELKTLQERHAKEESDKDPKVKQKEIDTLLADTTPAYITVPQLSFVLMELQLQMTSKEIEILATGFGSNGKGGIDSKELIDMIQALVYNLIGSHAMETTQPLGQSNGGRTNASYGSGKWTNFWTSADGSHQNDRSGRHHETSGNTRDSSNHNASTSSSSKSIFKKEFKRLIYETVENILQYDKRGSFVTTPSIQQALLKPFLEYDVEETGMIPFHYFTTILHEFGVLFSQYEYKLLAKPYVLFEAIPMPKHLTNTLTANTTRGAAAAAETPLELFRNERLLAHLRGALQVQQTPVLGQFLSQHSMDVPWNGKGKQGGPSAEEDEMDVDMWIQKNTMLLYPIFVQDLSDVFEHYIAQHEGLITNLHPKLSWTLEEFAFVDHLLNQLESMAADKRRKTLISLQYSLENADLNEEGELDGFAILSALINCGFQLQRYHRVTLLKAAEAYGGKLDYLHLILTLLQTATSWHHTEYHLIYKILTAMGMTIEERRDWLMNCKRALLKKSREIHTKLQIKHVTSRLLSSTDDEIPVDSGNADMLLEDSDTMHQTMMITPGMFLSILQQLHVHLSPEEEARLLDCLDTEQMAQQNMSRLYQKYATPAPIMNPMDSVDQREYRKQRMFQEANHTKKQKQQQQKKKALYHSIREDVLYEDEEEEDEEGGDMDEEEEERRHHALTGSRLDALGLSHARNHHHTGTWSSSTGGKKKHRAPTANRNPFDITPFQTPMINYASFLQFLTRHVGNWIYHNFPLYTALLSSLEEYSLYPLQDLFELLQLCQSFDEQKTNYIHIQHFMIVCYRSTLFSQFSKAFLQELSNSLLQDSDMPNYIQYKTFCLQLRGICSAMSGTATGKKTRHSSSTTGGELDGTGTKNSATSLNGNTIPVNLITQVVENGTDPQGKLSYLRNYLLMHCQYAEYHMLSIKEFHNLLREFNIIYQYHELELLYLEIGYEVDISLPEKSTSSSSSRARARSNAALSTDNKLQMIHMKSFLTLVMQQRISWVYTNPVLVKKLLAFMKDILLTGGNMSGGGGGGNTQGFVLDEGKLSALIQHIITRIQTFTLQTYPLPAQSTQGSAIAHTMTSSSHVPSAIGTMQQEKEHGNIMDENGLIEGYIFEYILKSMSIYLSKEDILFLADYSDPLPEATRINPLLLYDLLSCPFLASNSNATSTATVATAAISGGKNSSNVNDLLTPLFHQHSQQSSHELPMLTYEELTDSALYALNHLHSLLWQVAKRQHRNAMQWIADVTCIFEGFDRSGQGYITLEEFMLGLKLLSISISYDLLMNIPYAGYSPGDPYPAAGATGAGPATTTDTRGIVSPIRQGNSLVQYKKILAYVLQKKPLIRRKNRRGHEEEEEEEVEEDEMDYDSYFLSKEEKLRIGKEFPDEDEDEEGEDTRRSHRTLQDKDKHKKKSPSTSSSSSAAPSIVNSLFHVLRKQLSIFILSQSSMEEVWYSVTQIFQQYDAQHTGYVTPRQFCLAIGIVLGEEEIIYTASEWQSILEYFVSISREVAEAKRRRELGDSSRTSSFHHDETENEGSLTSSRKKSSQPPPGRFSATNTVGSGSRYARGGSGTTNTNKFPPGSTQNPLVSTTAYHLHELQQHHQYEYDGQINYLLMIEMLFDPKEMQKKMSDMKSLSKGSSSGGGHTMSSKLFISTGENNNKNYKQRDEDGAVSIEEMDRMKKQLSRRPSSSSATMKSQSQSQASQRGTRPSSHTSNMVKEDPIVKRFQQANAKYTSLLRGGKEYGNTSGSPMNAVGKAMTATIHIPVRSGGSPTGNKYNSQGNGRSASTGRVRFNATT